MAKKDFSNINTNPVFNTIAQAAAEPIPGQMEIADTDCMIEEVSADAIAADTAAAKKRERRSDYTEEEKLAAMNALKTGGKKGVKLPRINLAFTPDNYDFVKRMARVRGQNMTEFINDMLTEARTKHGDQYQKAIAFLREIDGE